jgi:hypothetical protein
MSGDDGAADERGRGTGGAKKETGSDMGDAGGYIVSDRAGP